MSFFSACGDIRYARIIGDDEETSRLDFVAYIYSQCKSQDLRVSHEYTVWLSIVILPESPPIHFVCIVFHRYAFIEFQEASCVAKALQYNGAMFGGEPLK